MKTSIETINGKLCTVILRPFDAEWAREQLAMGIPVHVACNHEGRPKTLVLLEWNGEYFRDGFEAITEWELLKYTLTILPALPRHPKPEHAPLLYRYMAEGLEIEFKWNDERRAEIEGYGWYSSSTQTEAVHWFLKVPNIEITHATHNGERIEIAIRESADA